MANSTHPVPHILGPGAAAIKLRALASGLSPHGWCPESWWSQRITAAQLVSLGTTTQISEITVSATGFTEGTISIAFSGSSFSTVTLTGIVAETDEDATAANIEAAIETARATSLAAIVDDESVTANVVDVTFIDGIGWVDITVTFTPSQQTWDVVFAGTIGDGNYDTTFDFDGYDPIVVRTTRSGGTPADEAALAAQHEADIEADSRLFGLIASADDDTVDTNAIVAEAGSPDLTITCSAPGSATLTPTETTGDTTITVVHNRDVSVDLNVAFPNNAVWSEVDRCWAGFYVIEEFDTNVTADLGDAGSATAVLSAVSLATAGWVSDTGNAQSDDYHESTWAPVLTVHFDDDDPDDGEVEVWVVLRKHQTGTV
jgi:hypothetical protein